MAKNQDVLVSGENLHVSKNVVQEQPDQQKQQPERKEVKDMEKVSFSRTVRAAKLKGIAKLPDGNVEMIPEDSAFAPIQLSGNEAANIKGFGPSDNTKDYGYVVIGDDGRREWMSSADFEALKSSK